MYKIFSLIANQEQVQSLREKYQAGNFGYGHAKKELLDLILTKYAKERELFDFYMNRPEEIEKRLMEGEEKARKVAYPLLRQIREKLGFN